MVVIKLTVIEANGKESQSKIDSELGYQKLLASYKVGHLIDDHGCKILTFTALVSNGKFTLRTPQDDYLTILVMDFGGRQRKIRIDDEEVYQDVLRQFNVICLIDDKETMIFHFKLLVNEGNYKLGEVLLQAGFDKELDITCCKLSSSFLTGAGLSSYNAAAASCANNIEVNKLLNKLEEYDVPNEKPCRFTCIVAPSGTGKTQLAATAAAANKNVVYFYTGLVDSESDNLSVQPFYKPHIAVKNELMRLVRLVRESVKVADMKSICGADVVFKKFQTSGDPLFGFLYKCLFGSQSPHEIPTAMTSQYLRNRILQREKNLLVFLDEVPPMEFDDFYTVMLLRNILRAVGVSPILMSTHSGSVNAIGGGTDSRGGEESLPWCRILVNLPLYQADDCVFTDNPWLKQSERPLVAAMMVNHTEKNDISNIVDAIQGKLQKQKPKAWLATPLMQLCQLFRTKSDYVQESYKHNIVGVHFGRIHIAEDLHEISRQDTANWIEKHVVRFVDPEKEPMLFLALTTWKMAHIEISSPRFFPLVKNGTFRQAVSVRDAFKNNAEFFQTSIYTKNDSAKKQDGDILEILALASITLASLQSDDGVFHSIKLPQFLASVLYFMCPDALQIDRIKNMAKDIQKLLTGTRFSSVTVPTCAVTDSNFNKVWSRVIQSSSLTGQVKRTSNKEQRDGVVLRGLEEVLHVECKNYSGGITTQVVKDVVTTMRHDCKVSVFFVSHLTNLFAFPDGLDRFTQDIDLKQKSICYLILKPGVCPEWLYHENGEEILNYRETETEYLAVFVCTGPIG